MKRIILILLLLTLAAQGQQQRIAILGTEDDGEPPVNFLELTHLTAKLREIAGKTLPKNRYIIMTQQSIVDRLGSQEQAAKICREATCLADLGRKISADYIAQARIGRFAGDLTIKIELYKVGNSSLVSSFTDNSKNIQGLLLILEAKSPALFIDMQHNDNVKSSANDYFLTDSRDKQKYRVIKIGSQTWMAENLNYNVNESKCFNNSESNCKKYGRLYNWDTAMKVCPLGWHLPTQEEWDVLSNSVGGSDTEGKHLKTNNGWDDYEGKNGNGQDTYSFAALPGGYGYSAGHFSGIGNVGYWWSASEINSNNAYSRRIYCRDELAYWYHRTKDNLFSVRCVKD